MLDGIDLEVAPGAVVLLAGASGSGKSTLLLGLAGLLDPEAGELGGVVTGPDRRALLLQQPEHAVVAETIGRDVAFGPENRAVPRPQIHEAVAEQLGALVPDVSAASGTLATSGGQLQRIALAGALAYDAEVLALDEPTSMLDPANAQQVHDAVAAAVGAGERTVIIAEHRIEPWLALADRMIVLGPGGRVLADGAVASVLADASALAAAGISLDDDAADAAVPSPDSPSPEPSSPAPSSPDAPDTAPVLRLAEAALSHPDGSGRLLQSGIDLEVRPGQAAAITGPSGAGKSTLLRTALGLDDPVQGTVERPAPGEISFVPQNPEHSFVAQTVADEVSASADADPALADELLEAVGLADMRGRNPYSLSGGEQQRLAIAAALASSPRLLVLDEPTVGLDAHRRGVVLDLLDQALDRGCGVVIATHDLPLARRCAAQLALEPGPPAIPSRRARPAPAARLNQLTMLAIGLLGMIGSFAIDSPLLGVLALAPTILLAPLAIGSPKRAALRVLPVVLGMATLAWSVMLLSPGPVFSRASFLLGLSEGLRIGALVLPGALVLGSLDATKLGDALGQRLRLPARFVVGACAGLAQLGTMRRRWQILMETRRLRGLLKGRRIGPYASAVLGMLVVSLRAATWQSIAMDARGFATAQHRTWAEPSPFTRADAIGLAIGVLLAVWPWALRLLGV